MKQPFLSDINQEFQDFQDDLTIRRKKLKIIPSFKEEDELDELISLLDIPDQSRDIHL